MDFFKGPNDNFNYLIDDENVNIKSFYVCYCALIRISSCYIYLFLSKFMYY